MFPSVQALKVNTLSMQHAGKSSKILTNKAKRSLRPVSEKIVKSSEKLSLSAIVAKGHGKLEKLANFVLRKKPFTTSQKKLILKSPVAFKLSGYIYNAQENINDIPKSWKRVGSVAKNNLASDAFKVGRNVIITTRGTINQKDISDDLALFFGKVPERYKDLIEFYRGVKKQYPKNQVIFTGHSLGGSVSQLAAVQTGEKAITFNPYSSYALMRKVKPDLSPKHLKNNIVNYCTNDIIANMRKQPGTNLYLHGSFRHPHRLYNFNKKVLTKPEKVDYLRLTHPKDCIKENFPKQVCEKVVEFVVSLINQAKEILSCVIPKNNQLNTVNFKK